MDVICPRCGEPWDFDSLHEETESRFAQRHPNITMPTSSRGKALKEEYSRIFSDVSGEFRGAGCVALRSMRGTDEPCTPTNSDRAVMAQAAYEALGDDMDGAAAMLEDWL